MDLSDEELVSLSDDLPLWSAPFGLKLLEVVKMGRNLTVLDVGCGAGFPTVELAARLGSSCRIYGIDPWPEALERARQKAAAWRIDSLRFEQAAAECLPFNDVFFDVIVSNNGLNNVRDDREALREISRVAKAGAQLVVTLNLPDTFLEFYSELITTLMTEQQRSKITDLFSHQFAKRKPLIYWRQMLETSGFRIQSIFQEQFVYRFSDGTAMVNHFLIRTAFMPSWSRLADEEMLAQVQQALDRRALTDGELTLTVPWCCITAERMGN